ncbi:MAG: hypothetical protein GF419_03390 [Ignavibacteriales bacterium]|nr:hypothetical protein [Ignavibacteriales bacterium]
MKTPPNYTIVRVNGAPEKVRFCPNCGEELERFEVAYGGDEKAAREQWARCRQSGRFDGDFCARVFIVADQDPDDVFIDEPNR